MRTTWPEIVQPQRENGCIFSCLPVSLLPSGLFSLPVGGFFAHLLRDEGLDVMIILLETRGRERGGGEVRERFPNSALAEADQIVDVDVLKKR